MTDTPITAPRTSLPYYGWFVLAAGAVTEMLAQGATSYGSGLFVLPLQSEFHLSRAAASSSVLVLVFGGIFAAPYAGKILDRHPIRRVITAGAALFAGALAAIALAPSLWIMVLALLVPGAAGFMLLGPMTTVTLASRWFFRRRGLALGIAAIAASGGGLVVVPLLSLAIQRQGWRPALLEEAILIFAIVAALALWVLKDNPFRAGLEKHPENKGRSDAALLLEGPAKIAGLHLSTAREILGRRDFWAPSLLLASISGIAQAMVVSAPAYGHQLGFAPAAAAFLISAFSIAAALTKILVGVLADLWDNRILLLVSALLLPLALALLYTFDSYHALLAAFALCGVALGGVLPTSAFLIAARFGAARFGAVMGWSYALLGLCIIAAVLFAGTMFDKSGSYQPAFLGLLLVSLAVSLAAFLLDWTSAPGRAD